MPRIPTSESVGAVARRLGVDPKIGRARVRRAVESGKIQLEQVNRRYIVPRKVLRKVEAVVAG